jgi:hypothetical protein
MMRRLSFLITAFLLIIILTGCNESATPVVPNNCEKIETVKFFEWGGIEVFTMNWWADLWTNETFSIHNLDGQHYLNVYISGDILYQPFVLENQPVSVYDVEVIRNILKENQAEIWNGFCVSETYGIEDWSGWSISIEMENGSMFRASGLNASPCNESFKTVDRELREHLQRMWERYAVIPE